MIIGPAATTPLQLTVRGTIKADSIISEAASGQDLATLDTRLKALESAPRMSYLTKEKNINTNASGYLDYSVSTAGVPSDAVSVLLSIQHRGNSYPGMTLRFILQVMEDDNPNIKHNFVFNSSDKSQTTHNSIWVPVVDSKIFYYISANNSWSVNIHTYTK